ncbi:MAG: cupin domain-containing protein, partial [Bacteroidota bacterium]
MQEPNAINIHEKFSLFEKQWTPHIIGELNGQYVKLCKLKDDFVWHSHENEDELFMVFKGTLLMDFRDGRTVEVKEGEIMIVPKGMEHRPHTNGEIVFNLLFEPKTTQHTGDVESEMDAYSHPLYRWWWVAAAVLLIAGGLAWTFRLTFTGAPLEYEKHVSSAG